MSGRDISINLVDDTKSISQMSKKSKIRKANKRPVYRKSSIKIRKQKTFNFDPVPLMEVYENEMDFQIYGNIPIDMRRPAISEELKENIKYMRRRIEIKHKNMELDKLEAEQKKKQK
jgi:hypothetical protein